ncbi:MAG: hypothetical protein ACHQC8_01660 [Solirubrobacterales bacterium]
MQQHGTASIGAGLPEFGRDAFWLMKHPPGMPLDDDGKKRVEDKLLAR